MLPHIARSRGDDGEERAGMVDNQVPDFYPISPWQKFLLAYIKMRLGAQFAVTSLKHA